jgi:hypothetical protein
MMISIKQFMWFVLTLTLLLTNSKEVFAVKGTYHLHAQHHYLGIESDYGNCTYGNRSTTLYCDNLDHILKRYGWKMNHKKYNTEAFEYDMTYLRDKVDDANLFVWGGHGIDYLSDVGKANGKESAAHFYNLNSTTSFHPITSHNDGRANASWSEIRWGNTIDYAVMWTCNFLHTGGDSANLRKILKMFDKMHIMLGFASKMYVNPDEGKSFGDYLIQGYKLKDAWVNATLKYQPQIGTSPSVYASWVYHVDHESDTLSLHSDPIAYSDAKALKFARKYYKVAN